MNEYWQGRGYPWEYDPGPPRNRRWARLFAQTPNYRKLGIEAVPGKRERFRWHFGPMFYRGRLRDNSVKVLIIGQEGAQDESLSHRAFTGGTGARLQHFLNYIGITESYLFLNTFFYPIYGQYGSGLKWLAQNPNSPIVQHRHDVLNYALERNDVHLVIAVGNAAKESVVTWIESRGGTCPGGIRDISKCTASNLDPSTKVIGVLHPGSASKGENKAKIVADFKRALVIIKQWMEEDPNWLPADPTGKRKFDTPYKYGSAPIPFNDFPYGLPMRLGSGGTSSNRMDNQRSIQIFSADGSYNMKRLVYQNQREGSDEGYQEDSGDVPYEPPKVRYDEFDTGPGPNFAQLLMGGEQGYEWPNFSELGVTAHPSFGCGAIYRGRPEKASVFVLADQESHDNLFTGRALTGESGQRLQEFLRTMGIAEAYVIIRTLPVDVLDLQDDVVKSIVLNAQTLKVHQEILNRVKASSQSLKLVLTFGPHAKAVIERINASDLFVVNLKAWREQGALENWRQKLQEIKSLEFDKDITAPTFDYDGKRGQIPRMDLPFGTPRWIGTSGDRANRPLDPSTQKFSPNYYILYMPLWAYQLEPLPLSTSEQEAIDKIS